VNVDESGHPIPHHRTVQDLQKKVSSISFEDDGTRSE